MKTALVVVLVFLTVGISLSVNLLDQFGVERNYIFIGLGAALVTALVATQHIALIAIIFTLTLPINLSEEYLRQYYIDRDVLMVVVILLILFPLAYTEFVSKK